MKFKKQICRIVFICLFISVGYGNATVLSAGSLTGSHITPTEKPEDLNTALTLFIGNGDLVNCGLTVEKLLQQIGSISIDERTLSDSYYLIGIYYLLTNAYSESTRYLELCIHIKEKRKEYDIRYARAFYNLGVAYSLLADISKCEYYALKSLEIGKKVYSESDPALLSAYLAVSSLYVQIKEYEKAISNANTALLIAEKNPASSLSTIAGLYNNLGVCYIRQADFSKAKLYFEKAESIYNNSNVTAKDEYINLMNSLGFACNSLGLGKEAEYYYKRGVDLAVSENSSRAYNIINSYSLFLASSKKVEKGDKLLRNALERSRAELGDNPNIYYEVLNNYAGYLRENKIDNSRSIECYRECLDYLKNNDRDPVLKTAVYSGYSKSLQAAGNFEEALSVIQSLLDQNGDHESLSVETIKPDLVNLNILKLKYSIQWDIYRKTASHTTLADASGTSEQIISLLDRIRINISEEESRLILGDKFRDSYLNAIRDFNLLYKETADNHFLAKAFEYAEKSKVASLLTSTRELKAAQFHVPPELGNIERELQSKISFTSARIDEVMAEKNPDMSLIAQWKENLLIYSRIRDSLIVVFEKQYPGYYALKYNSQKVDFKDIPSIFGRSGNYINYVVADDELYIFVVNRKTQQLLSFPVDSSFFNDIRKFRSLLAMPDPSDNARSRFKEFQETGHRLYKLLIEPVKSYLISDKVVISPDNLLSYLPFEVFPSSLVSGEEIKYRDLEYLMKDIDISYTYSATFMAESVKKEKMNSNKLIAFAPDYPEPIDIQSAFMSRQGGLGVLNDLPHARREAAFVSETMGGRFYENSQALESVYKNESGKYDIIHLAMHTLLNDKDPMRSTLIFSNADDSPEDGYLKTYEIYGIPLNAKMVVLSSCNTGTGVLYSGEGILSLARGFIYSGSQSVVMSMWEIEDKSGTEIVEKFYENLKKGYSKNTALKRARIDFLKNADQLRSHPYFWSALVVYGNNSSLYPNMNKRIYTYSSGALIFLLAVFYFFKRKFS